MLKIGKSKQEMNRKVYSAKLNKRQSSNRLIVLVVCAFFVIGSLLSAAFIFTHARHEHNHSGSGGACSTCEQLAEAENLLKFLLVSLADAVLIFWRFPAIYSFIKPVGIEIGFFTLVCLKIRLNK